MKMNSCFFNHFIPYLIFNSLILNCSLLVVQSPIIFMEKMYFIIYYFIIEKNEQLNFDYLLSIYKEKFLEIYHVL